LVICIMIKDKKSSRIAQVMFLKKKKKKTSRIDKI